MAWRFKLIGKKRGARATGSHQEGRVGEAIFYLVFFSLGAAALVMVILNLIVPEWRVNQVYETAQATVLNTKIEVVKNDEVTDDAQPVGDDSPSPENIPSTAPESKDEVAPSDKDGQEGDGEVDTSLRYQPQIQIQYQVGDSSYTKWTYRHWPLAFTTREEAIEVTVQFEIGQTYSCWYDPADPRQVVLARGYNWWVWLILLLPTTFMLVGLGGLAYTLFYSGTSRERRASFAKQVADREIFDTGSGQATEFPFVPADTNLKNSPGTKLKYRLPIEVTPGWKLAGFIIACLFWNGIVSIFVVMAISSHLSGTPDWLLTLFMLPFAGVGAWLIYRVIRQLLIATGVGPTLIEITDHPLQPGKEYEILLTQSGNLSIRQMDVQLICQEKATYRQGTDTVTDTETVCRLPILNQYDVDVEAGLPFETRCTFSIPTDAMHSFLANTNAVNWKLSVHVQLQRWPDFHRDFPVVVRPQAVQTETP